LWLNHYDEMPPQAECYGMRDATMIHMRAGRAVSRRGVLNRYPLQLGATWGQAIPLYRASVRVANKIDDPEMVDVACMTSCVHVSTRAFE